MMPLNAFCQIDMDQFIKKIQNAEEMPRFPGCEEVSTDIKEKDLCARQKMQDYFNNKLKYPEQALENKVEGLVFVRFTVNEFGGIEDPMIMRSVGFGCDEEAIRLVESMNEMEESWIPGKQEGELVKVFYDISIYFTLPE